eukprot:3936718-Rhodomonas_salina.1
MVGAPPLPTHPRALSIHLSMCAASNSPARPHSAHRKQIQACFKVPKKQVFNRERLASPRGRPSHFDFSFQHVDISAVYCSVKFLPLGSNKGRSLLLESAEG